MPSSSVKFSNNIQKLILLIVVGCFIFAYLSLVPLGAKSDARRFNNYYRTLAQSLTVGHLDVGDAPQALLNLKDPYNPDEGGKITRDPKYRVWDFSLYNNKLYLYFGLTPAIVYYLPLTILSLDSLATDFWALFIAAIAIVFINLSIVRALERRFGEESQPLLTATRLAIVLSLNLIPLVLARGRTYEVALIFGQAFSLLAIRMLIGAIISVSSQIQPPALKTYLVCAATFAGLAVGCRPHYLIGLGLTLIFAVICIQRQYLKQTTGQILLATFTPFVVIIAILATYNYLRFDNIFEFGVTWQLGMFDARNVPSLDPQRFLFNLYFLTVHPPKVISEFPWLVASTARTFSIPSSDIRYVERPVGFIIAFPILLFTVRSTWQSLRNIKSKWLNGIDWRLLFIIPMLSNFIILTLWVASIDRYSADFLGYAAVLAVFALPVLKSSTVIQRLVSTCIALLTIISCGAAWALAYSRIQ